MAEEEQHAKQTATQEVNEESWLRPSTYTCAINARHASEHSFLSIVNAHILANTILFTAISMLLTVKKPGLAGNIIISCIALLGLFLARQTRLAFLIARGNNICWDKIIRKYEREKPIFKPPTRGGLYTLNHCVMTNGKTCKASPIRVVFSDENVEIEKAIRDRNKWHAKRMKLYPMVFGFVYILLIAFTWRDHLKSPF